MLGIFKKKQKEVKQPTKIEVKPGNFGTARSFKKDPTYKGTPITVRIVKRRKIEVKEARALG